MHLRVKCLNPYFKHITFYGSNDCGDSLYMFVMNMFNQPKSPHSTHGTNIHFKLVSYIIKQMIIVLLYYNNTREIPTSLESYSRELLQSQSSRLGIRCLGVQDIVRFEGVSTGTPLHTKEIKEKRQEANLE